MSKISLETIIEVMAEQNVEPPKQEKIIQHLKDILEEEKKERESEKMPKQKNQFVVVVKSEVDLTNKEVVATVFQMPQDSDPNMLLSKIADASKAHNLVCKRAKNKVSTFDDAISHVKRKFTKEQGYLPKTKDWVQAIVLTKDKIIE